MVKDLVKTSMTLTFKSFWRAGNYVLKKKQPKPSIPLAFNNSFFFFFLKWQSLKKYVEVLGEISRLKSLQKCISEICHHFSTVFRTGVLMILIPSFSLTFFLKQIAFLFVCLFCCVFKKKCLCGKTVLSSLKWMWSLWEGIFGVHYSLRGKAQRKGQMLYCILVF